MKRTVIITVVALCGVLALVLAACGGGGTDQGPEPRPPADCKVKPEACK